ncbi:MAG: hypothetical protein GX535_08100 [Xanthomonadaceae bacterium]|nr:hypothetical protein [Xanthomonadaceae bacterium]
MEVRGGVRAGWRAVGSLVSLTAVGWLPMSTCAAAHAEAQILYFEPLQIRVPQTAASGARQKASRELSKLELSAFGRDYDLTVETNETFHESLAAKPSRSTLTLYRGSIDGLASSWVRLATQGTDVHGMVWDGVQLYVIAPSDQVRHQLVPPLQAQSTSVIFRMHDVLMPAREASCATGDAPAPIERGSDAYDSLVRELRRAKGDLGATMRLELAVLADALFRDRHLDEQAARDGLLIRLNNIDGIYSSQLGVHIQAPLIDILDAENRTLSETRNADALLKELAKAREKSFRHRSRGLTHLFTARDLEGETVGIAYVDSLCDPKYGVGLTEVSTRGAWYESLIAAHEIGHNFGAVHDGEGVCASTPQGAYLMSPNVNGVEAFSDCSLSMMHPKVAAAKCIVPLPPANVRVAADLGTVRSPAGVAFDYELPVANAGGATAMNVRAEVLVPPTIVVEDAYVIGGSCTSGAGVVQCQMGNITGGTSRPVYLTFRGTTVGTSSISAKVFADNDTNIADNEGNGTLAIVREADVSLEVDAPAQVAAMSAFELRFTTTNGAAIDARDVRTSLTLPEGITASSATQSGGTCTIEGAELVCVRPTLEAGETSFGTIVLTAAQAGLATFRVQTSGSYVDPVGTNDSAEVSIEVVPTPAPSTAQRDTRDGGGGGSSGLLLALLGILGLWRRRTEAT